MKSFFEKICTRHSALRHLTLLAVSFGIAVWSYVSISLIQRDWSWFSLDHHASVTVSDWLYTLGVLFALPMVFAALSLLILFNARVWMKQLLKKSLAYFINAFLFGAWKDTYSNLRTPDEYVTVTYYSDGTKEEDDGSVPPLISLILAIPLTLIKNLFLSLMNLIGAIGIPVFSPVLSILILAAVDALCRWNLAVGFIFGILCLVVSVFATIVMPVLYFTKFKTAVPTEQPLPEDLPLPEEEYNRL